MYTYLLIENKTVQTVERFFRIVTLDVASTYENNSFTLEWTGALTVSINPARNESERAIGCLIYAYLSSRSD